MAHGGASTPSSMPPLGMGLRLSLSVMMFLEFAVWGAWFVVFIPYLLKLGFDGAQAGAVFGNMALGAIISPMFIGLIADRYLASERLMAILHLLGAALLYWMAQIQSTDQFPLLFVVSLMYALVYNPTLALTNSITFTHVPDGTRDFPGIRVLGTIGWIVANLVVGKYFDFLTNQPLLLAAGLSAGLGIFSLFLPHTPPTSKAGDPFPFVRALSLFRNPSFAVFFGVSGVITIVLAFYYSFTGEFLVKVVRPDNVPSWLQWYFVTSDVKTGAPVFDMPSMMVIGQYVEMLLLPLLPLFLWRLGMKWVLALGMLAWGVRYGLFAMGGPFGWLVLGVALHGICFDFFFAAGFIHVDNTAPNDIRGSAQSLFALLTYGLGMWLGSLLSGFLHKLFTHEVASGEVVTNWTTFWIIPSIGVLASLLVFVLFFHIPRYSSQLPGKPDAQTA
jgi:nucleoside transporter